MNDNKQDNDERAKILQDLAACVREIVGCDEPPPDTIAVRLTLELRELIAALDAEYPGRVQVRPIKASE